MSSNSTIVPQYRDITRDSADHGVYLTCRASVGEDDLADGDGAGEWLTVEDENRFLPGCVLVAIRRFDIDRASLPFDLVQILSSTSYLDFVGIRSYCNVAQQCGAQGDYSDFLAHVDPPKARGSLTAAPFLGSGSRHRRGFERRAA